MENEKPYESWLQVSNPSYWIENLMMIIAAWPWKSAGFRNRIRRNHALLVMGPIPEEPRDHDGPEEILSRNHDRKNEDSALHEARHAEGSHSRRNWSGKVLQVWMKNPQPASHKEAPLLRTLLTSSRHPAKRLLLFYRYMLPHVTTEAYSWADPENQNSGFKTGVENCFSLIDDGMFAFFFTAFISNGSYFRPVCRFILWGLFDRYMLGIKRYWRVDTQKTLVQ